jgi:hypothetical protein
VPLGSAKHAVKIVETAWTSTRRDRVGESMEGEVNVR